MARGFVRTVATVAVLCAALMVGPVAQTAVAQTEPPPPTYPYPECSPSLSALVLLALSGRSDLPPVILYIHFVGGKPGNCVVIVPEQWP